MKTQILHVGLALAVVVMGTPAPSRLPAQEPKDKKIIPMVEPVAFFHLTVAEFTKDGVLVAPHPVIATVHFETKVITVKTRDGKLVPVHTIVQVPSIQLVTEKIDLKAIKAFVVKMGGKLEQLDTAKLSDMLKKPTPVLIGTKTEVDPPLLEPVMPGTIYLAIPPRVLDPQPKPEKHDKKKA